MNLSVLLWNLTTDLLIDFRLADFLNEERLSRVHWNRPWLRPTLTFRNNQLVQLCTSMCDGDQQCCNVHANIYSYNCKIKIARSWKNSISLNRTTSKTYVCGIEGWLPALAESSWKIINVLPLHIKCQNDNDANCWKSPSLNTKIGFMYSLYDAYWWSGSFCNLRPLLLTWIHFNPSIDK